MRKNSFWSPYISGVGIGLTLLATFYITGKGLGASGAFSAAAAAAVHGISPGYAGSLKYFSRYLSVESPLMDWIVIEVCGLFLGAFAGALASRDFKLRFDGGRNIGVGTRLLTAFAGGVLVGFSSRLARGCTSGVALSGGAELAVSGWIFAISLFISGFIPAALFRRLWS